MNSKLSPCREAKTPKAFGFIVFLTIWPPERVTFWIHFWPTPFQNPIELQPGLKECLTIPLMKWGASWMWSGQDIWGRPQLPNTIPYHSLNEFGGPPIWEHIGGPPPIIGQYHIGCHIGGPNHHPWLSLTRRCPQRR